MVQKDTCLPLTHEKIAIMVQLYNSIDTRSPVDILRLFHIGRPCAVYGGQKFLCGPMFFLQLGMRANASHKQRHWPATHQVSLKHGRRFEFVLESSATRRPSLLCRHILSFNIRPFNNHLPSISTHQLSPLHLPSIIFFLYLASINHPRLPCIQPWVRKRGPASGVGVRKCLLKNPLKMVSFPGNPNNTSLNADDAQWFQLLHHQV